MPTEPTNSDLMAALNALGDEARKLKATRPSPTGLVDVDGLAAYLDISPRTVRQMVANRDIATKRVGRSLRFDLGHSQRKGRVTFRG